MGVHESGHVLNAWVSGGTVTKVVLGPLIISRTDVSPNPHALFVAWGGAFWGSGLPLVVWLAARFRRARWAYLSAFFAGFCLITNGAYLGVGAFEGIGDARTLLHGGAPQWTLLLFGIVAVVPGFWFWHGLGPHFGLGTAHGGLGTAHGKVNETDAVVMAVLFVLLVGIELVAFR